MKRGMAEMGNAGIGGGIRNSRLGVMGMVADEWEMNGNWAFPSSDHLCNSHQEPLHDPKPIAPFWSVGCVQFPAG